MDETFSGMLITGIFKMKSLEGKSLASEIAFRYSDCASLEQVYALNDEIAAFCSHVRNSLEKDNTLTTKPVSK